MMWLVYYAVYIGAGFVFVPEISMLFFEQIFYILLYDYTRCDLKILICDCQQHLNMSM